MLKLFSPVEPTVLHFFNSTSRHSMELVPRPPMQYIWLFCDTIPKSFLLSRVLSSITVQSLPLGSYTSTVSRLRSLFLPPTAYTSPSTAHAPSRKRGEFMGLNVVHFSCFVSKRSVDAKAPSGLWPPITYNLPDRNATPLIENVNVTKLIIFNLQLVRQVQFSLTTTS